MPKASATFTNELAAVCAEIRQSESRLRALHDLGAYEELPREAVERIKRKANAIEMHCTDLEEIPGMVA